MTAPTEAVADAQDEADEPSPPTAAAQAARGAVLVHTPLSIRNASLVLLAVIACLFMLQWAKAVFIPLLLGLMFSYALTPVVDRLVRWRLPRAVASALVLLVLFGGIGSTIYSLADDANVLIESLPGVAQKLRVAVSRRARNPVPIDKVQQAANEIEKAAEVGAAASSADRGVTRVRIEKARFDIQDYLWTGTIGFAAFVGQAVIVAFITLFLLASGNSFRRKMVRIAGPTFTQKKITIQALDEITDQVQRYLLVQLLTSFLVAVATWLAFLWIGVNNAPVWGLIAGVLNLIPYLGAIVITGGSALVGLVQFGSLDSALLIAGVSLTLHIVSGYVLTPWLTSRASRLSAVTVFVSVLAWGWLWGVWGLLLGAPIMMAVKAVCDRIDDLKPVGELLGT
ncbi:MAG: AI-2E family transporter [Caldimonas sp.]